jgi:hypothetical protein
MTVRDVLGDLVAVVHAGFVLFVLGGFVMIVVAGPRGRRRRWRGVRRRQPLRLAYLAAVTFTLVRVWLGMTCPLWILEDGVRGGAPVRVNDGVARWCHRICFRGAPHLPFKIAVTVFAALVFAQMILAPALKRRAAGASVAARSTP